MVSRNCQILVTTSLVFSALSFPIPVRAANVGFERTFVFGDSLSDTGNVSSITNNLFPPQSLYTKGRFSNHLIWIDYVNQNLGLNPSTFYGGSFTNADDDINLAVGSATTGTTSLAESDFPGLRFPGVTAQVNDFINFINTTNTVIDENDLFVLWAGGNDYVDGLFNQGIIINPEVPTENIFNSLTDLANSGAKNVLVPNLPNLGDFPVLEETGIPDQLNLLTTVHNNLLSQRIGELSVSFPETNFVLFDVNSVLKNIFDDPTAFGLNEDPLISCLEPNNFPDIAPDVMVCEDPNKFFYFDNQHFTTPINQAIADAAIETIREEFHAPIPESRNTVGLITLGVALLLQLGKRKG